MVGWVRSWSLFRILYFTHHQNCQDKVQGWLKGKWVKKFMSLLFGVVKISICGLILPLSQGWMGVDVSYL